MCERRQRDQYATRKAPSMKGKVGLEKWRWRYTAGKRGREERGRLDSIKPKPAGKQFGILHFFSEFFGDFFLLFYSFYRLSTWFKDGGLILYRVDDCFSVFSSLWRWVFRVKCWPQSCARSLLWNTWKENLFLFPPTACAAFNKTFNINNFSG